MSDVWREWSEVLGPLPYFAAYFGLGAILFVLKTMRAGMPIDEETTSRGASALVGFGVRHYFFWTLQPLWKLVWASGLPAASLTTLATLFGLLSGVAAASGNFALAGWLFLSAGICDVLDGRIARTRGEATKAGAALDSVLDRYVDSALIMGLAWYYRSSWVLALALLAFLGSQLVPYVRARGEGLGVSVKDGLASRLERVLFLGLGTALAPLAQRLTGPLPGIGPYWLCIIGLGAVALLANITAISRLFAVLRLLSPTAKPPGRTFGWTAVSSALATIADYVVAHWLYTSIHLSPGTATLLGAVVGGVLNFTINRRVAFQSTNHMGPQAAKYALISGSSAALNALGVNIASALAGTSFTAAWWLVRGGVYALWNLPNQAWYVFEASPARQSK